MSERRIALDDRAIAWAKGYRAALDDLEALIQSRGLGVRILINDLREDAANIEGQARRWLARQKLRAKGRGDG